ncbi:hypothetical protein RclHR1_10970007 [Rhizophagus clarus]|nr:hypothetical protein RclHR1_10970007 [Rhizophagus clarus]
MDEISNPNNNPYVSLKKQYLYYVNVRGLTNQAKQIACRGCDESFIVLLEDYISKKNKEALNLQSGSSRNISNIDADEDQQITGEQEVDQENVNPIRNPIIRRPKGRPPRTARFKGPLQTSTRSNEASTSRKCGLYNKNGHNCATCPMNPNRKKRNVDALD